MRANRRSWSATIVTLVLALVTLRARGAEPDARESADLSAILTRAGERVAAFFSRAQSLVCLETVSIRALDLGMASLGLGRTVESELRLSWAAGPDGLPAETAETRRQVLRVNRRPPRKDDPRNCTVPEQQETETPPLSMLLPSQREAYAFTPAGTARVDGRAAILVDFRHLAPAAVDVRTVADNEDCIAYDLNGGLRGRLWIDRASMDVLRLEHHLAGLVEVRLPKLLLRRRPGVDSHWTLERWDTTIRFAGVTFSDPAESLVLPVSSSTLQITRGGSQPRLRTEITYANYKRFLTSGRVVG